MTFAELAVWALWAVVVTLTLVLYLRVNVHDWGMVGLVIVLMGATTLVTRSLLRYYGWLEIDHETLFLWRALVLIGAPLAIAGYIAGLWRDPPPARQIVRRIVVLTIVVTVLTLLMAL